MLVVVTVDDIFCIINQLFAFAVGAVDVPATDCVKVGENVPPVVAFDLNHPSISIT